MNADLLEKEWDVLVIGTGIGGGTIGRRLAERGLTVLFVEKGPFGLDGEQQYLSTELDNPAARQVRGYWPKPLNATIDGRSSTFYGALGSGVGGTSSFYAATLERPERHDIDDSMERPHPTGGWPASYDTFVPYFEQAETMYQVCGNQDPLSSEAHKNLLAPPPLAEDDQAMADSFRSKGMHPYHVHMGVRFVPGCLKCFGHKCPRRCKMDARTAGIDPALTTGNATVLGMCDVRAIRANGDRVTHLEAVCGGRAIKLRAKNYVLAAGGLGSPRLLLASGTPEWPRGLANRSGLVGRNLMFHLTEMVAIWPERGSVSAGATKSLAMRDFYYNEGKRYGALQAMGVDASYGTIVSYLNSVFDKSAVRNLKPLRELTRLPAYAAAKMFGNAKIFAGIIEDLPYDKNRVELDEHDIDRPRFTYEISDELHQRRRQYREILRRRFAGHRIAFLTFQPELNIAHSCGTVRFGDDPNRSVLDRNCRVHDLQNLYVIDSSFMPTSLGINPSLMIASNALRVADHLVSKAHSSATESLVAAQ